MVTPQQRSTISAIAEGQTPPEVEPFCPPEPTDGIASLTDGRAPGDYCSRYSWAAWLQIIFELLYLLCILAFSSVYLVELARENLADPQQGIIWSFFSGKQQLLTWSAVAAAGVAGGCASSLKWLYHGVAKARWHRDRIIWRLIVPILSAVVAIFSGLMIKSGIVPFLNSTPLSSPDVGAAFGFFVGFFSDNVLASLQKVALRLFGTIDEKISENQKSG